MDKENNIILYQDENGITNVNVLFSDEDLWLTQNQIAEIYDTTKQNIGQHIKNILADGELPGNSVVKDFFTTAVDRKQYNTKHYSLDMIIAIGYRVQSQIATRFRRWAELQAIEERFMTMSDWITALDRQILAVRSEVLRGNGRISRDQAFKKAEEEFQIYRAREMKQLESDFDKAVKALALNENGGNSQ
jgi:hypothetical protein